LEDITLIFLVPIVVRGILDFGSVRLDALRCPRSFKPLSIESGLVLFSELLSI